MTNVSGKSQGLTYDTVREHILQQIQKSLRNGEDLASALRRGKDDGIKDGKPIGTMAVKKEVSEKMKADAFTLAAMKY